MTATVLIYAPTLSCIKFASGKKEPLITVQYACILLATSLWRSLCQAESIVPELSHWSFGSRPFIIILLLEIKTFKNVTS